MVSLVGVVGLLVIVGVNTAIAALLTRFFRVRLDTRWGPVVYTLLLTPVVLLVPTLLLGAVVPFDLGSSAAVVAIALVLPMTLGVAFDYLWMPSPDEVELPADYGRENSPRR
jgi:phosphohistidine swiveling domain-containing protein